MNALLQKHESDNWIHIIRINQDTKDMCNEFVQPIADRVAQTLEIISKNFQFSTRRTRIPIRFFIYYLVLIINPMGRILVR